MVTRRGDGVGCVVWRWADGGRVELVAVVVARRGEGVEGVCRLRTPPSRVLSEGGGEEGGGVSTEKLPPSVSPFERGRGWRWWWWCVDRETTPLRLAF